MKKEFLVLILIFVFASLFQFSKFQSVSYEYNVSSCLKENFLNQNLSKPKAFWINNDLVIEHFVSYVCCAKIFPKVSLKENKIIIFEENRGDVCRCICNYKILIKIHSLPKKNYSIEIYGIKYKDIHKPKLLENFSVSLKNEFCGISTFGKCFSDKDCIVDGCNSEVCRSVFEDKVFTVCQWKECYNWKKFGIECKCINGKCQWK
ncbi:MAG: hypothetical protein B6U78_02930 [Candidatus Aenigmarchaeota archaeon ex4484_224]|nr:MAG: hypothetical protein B6U78_02930 [Candidatus Aenigmarchaeota archaeon ex4484_224]